MLLTGEEKLKVLNTKSLPKISDCNEIESLREKVCALNLENAEVNGTLESILSSEEMSTFEKGRYTDDMRMCIYELLSLNVGVCNVSQIIRCVLKNIAHKSVTRLPSYDLTCQIILEYSKLGLEKSSLKHTVMALCKLMEKSSLKQTVMALCKLMVLPNSVSTM